MTEFLDRNSLIPLYHQLTRILRDQITRGEYSRGDTFPSENELMRTFNVSRNTVRQALSELENLGLVRRTQGKGTFVASSRVRSRSAELSSFTDEVVRLGRMPGVILKEVEQVEAPLRVAEKLECSPGEMLLRITRIRTADEDPIALAISWLNIVRYPQLMELDFEQISLYALYESVLGISILRATQHVFADGARKQEAIELNIPLGEPVLRFYRTTYLESELEMGSAIEYVEAGFIGNMYSLETELFRRPKR